MAITINGDTGVSGVDGTVSNPALEGSDPNTGVYFPAADTVGLITNGSERMRVDSSGNVGIGTSSPSAKLHVNGNIKAFQGSYVGVARSDGSLVSYISNVADNETQWRSDGGGAFSTFYTSGTERMRIDSSGNVGIGTTSPTFTTAGGLHINKSSDVTVDLHLTNATTGSSATDGFDLLLSGLDALLVQRENANMAFYTNASERMRITANGGVSFGSSGTAYGTAGQVLQSNGDAAPTWTTISTSASGTLIRAPQVLTSGTSYTTPSNCTRIYVQMVGGGGGAGGANPDSNSTGAGGGGGGYLEVVATVTGSTAYSYAIGGGGAGGPRSFAGNDGSAGGNTTITISGTTYTAGGGSGGQGGSNPASVRTGGAGGTSTNGTFNIRGNIGANSGGAGNTAVNGGGGGGIFASNYTPGGSSASLYGSGGSTNASNTAGNAGGQGVIRIWEYT